MFMHIAITQLSLHTRDGSTVAVLLYSILFLLYLRGKMGTHRKQSGGHATAATTHVAQSSATPTEYSVGAAVPAPALL